MINDILNPYLDSRGNLRFGTRTEKNAKFIANLGLGKKSSILKIENMNLDCWWMVIIYKPAKPFRLLAKLFM